MPAVRPAGIVETLGRDGTEHTKPTRKANPFLDHLQEEILLSTTPGGQHMRTLHELQPFFFLGLPEDGTFYHQSIRKQGVHPHRTVKCLRGAQWGMGVTGDPQNFYCMFSENPSPQFTLVTIYLQIPFFRNPRQLRGLYIGLDYNRNPVARRILLIKKSDCTDTEEFLSMESGLIQKEDFTSEQQAYYDYTCQTGDYIKMCTVPSLQMDESDLVKEKTMLLFIVTFGLVPKS